MVAVTKIKVQVGGDPTNIKTFVGRDAWALDNLIRAGKEGCTPLTHVGPRWSHYIFKLRRGGLIVETVTEGHAGPFAGHHARYVLHSQVEVLDRQVAA